ncbi:MAG: hypothetical protein V3T70_00550 [Phycisphaerae bacterium]
MSLQPEHDACSTTTAAIRPARRWRRWAVMAALLAVFALWFGRFAYLRITLRPTPRPEYWAAKIAALDPPPEGAMAWKDVQPILTNRPWETMPGVTGQFKYDVTCILDGNWDPNRKDIVAADIAFRSPSYRDAREMLERAVEAGWREPYLPTPNARLSSLSACRGWARWLVAESRWRREAMDDVEGAVECWMLMFRLDRQMRRPQIRMAHLTALALHSLCANEMMRAALEESGAIDSRRLALAIDNFVQPDRPLGDLLEGERLRTHSDIEYIWVRDGGDWIDISEHARLFNWGVRGAGPSRIWNLASPLFHRESTVRARLDNAFARVAADPDWLNIRRIRFSYSAPSNDPNDIGVLDGLEHGFDHFLRWFVALHLASVCETRASAAMIALAQYHRRHGRYPDSLSELVPEFLPAVPIDVVDGEPLRYRLTDDSYILYSIGVNKKDDGGRCKEDTPTRFYEENLDVVYSAVRRRGSRE